MLCFHQTGEHLGVVTPPIIEDNSKKDDNVHRTAAARAVTV